ncbi:hypothetical protein AVEN_99022-1 [Araneus ventricosus]|uniref:Uncharacterized protein n=1 Tax=Araneus ventricosus TaxID=182803 RepID=A0A4Y2G7J6_ARAVE|nr:hypothetical protein AVEN_99022-1 [Araneus ventricosus]
MKSPNIRLSRPSKVTNCAVSVTPLAFYLHRINPHSSQISRLAASSGGTKGKFPSLQKSLQNDFGCRREKKIELLVFDFLELNTFFQSSLDPPTLEMVLEIFRGNFLSF